MEFICILYFFMVFVYFVCRLDGKPFFIWPYCFYILIFVVFFYVYLLFCRFVFSIIKKVVEFVRVRVKASFSVKRNVTNNANTNQAELETGAVTETAVESEEKSLDNTT